MCDIDRTGPAFASGLKFNCRIVEIGSITASTLTQDQLIELLRTSKTVTVSLIPPLDDGTPRRYCSIQVVSFSFSFSWSLVYPTCRLRRAKVRRCKVCNALASNLSQFGASGAADSFG